MTDLGGRLLNTGLRSVGLFAKFLLIFFMAKWLRPEELALFGLLTVSIIYVLLILGCEFYLYSTREIIASPDTRWRVIIRDQSVFHLLAYVVALPFIIMIFYFGLLPWSLGGWFVALLVVEHVAQETNRLLVAMSQPVLAGWVMFFRVGLWAIVIIVLMFFLPALRELRFVIIAWLTGSIVAAGFGFWKIMQLTEKQIKGRVDLEWIRLGLKVAIPIFLANLAFRGILTVDRYFVESTVSLELLGAYVFYIGVAGALASLIESGVTVYSIPKIVFAAQRNNYTDFIGEFRSLALSVLAIVGLFSISSLVLIEPVVALLDNPIYIENLNFYKGLLMALCLYALGIVPHVGLYALSKDRSILVGNLIGISVLVVTFLLLSNSLGIEAIILGINLAFLFILFIKAMLFYTCLGRFKEESDQAYLLHQSISEQ